MSSMINENIDNIIVGVIVCFMLGGCYACVTAVKNNENKQKDAERTHITCYAGSNVILDTIVNGNEYSVGYKTSKVSVRGVLYTSGCVVE